MVFLASVFCTICVGSLYGYVIISILVKLNFATWEKSTRVTT